MSDILIALGFGFFFILVIVPILALIGISLVDVLARQDIGLSRLVWLAVLLGVPLGGMLLYWLFRPKDFNPLDGPRPEWTTLTFSRDAALAAAPAGIPQRPSPQPRMTPALQGGSDPEPLEADEEAQ